MYRCINIRPTQGFSHIEDTMETSIVLFTLVLALFLHGSTTVPIEPEPITTFEYTIYPRSLNASDYDDAQMDSLGRSLPIVSSNEDYFRTRNSLPFSA